MSFTFYGFWRSAASYRVRVALNLKSIPYEEKPVDILNGEQFLPEFVKINPSSAIPVIIHEGVVLTQSLAIMDWLEDMFPTPSILIKDPSTRARMRAFALITAADAHPLISARVRKVLTEQLGATQVQTTEWVNHWVKTGLMAFEKELGRGPQTHFAFSDYPSLADIALMSHLAIMDFFDIGTVDDWPHVARVARRCAALPAFAKAHPFRQPNSPPIPPGRKLATGENA